MKSHLFMSRTVLFITWTHLGHPPHTGMGELLIYHFLSALLPSDRLPFSHKRCPFSKSGISKLQENVFVHITLAKFNNQSPQFRDCKKALAQAKRDILHCLFGNLSIICSNWFKQTSVVYGLILQKSSTARLIHAAFVDYMHILWCIFFFNFHMCGGIRFSRFPFLCVLFEFVISQAVIKHLNPNSFLKNDHCLIDAYCSLKHAVFKTLLLQYFSIYLCVLLLTVLLFQNRMRSLQSV